MPAIFFKILFIYFLRKGKGGRKRGIHALVASWLSLTRPLLEIWPATQMCPDWELNQQPFSSQAYTHSTEPNQPGFSSLNRVKNSGHSDRDKGYKKYIDTWFIAMFCQVS